MNKNNIPRRLLLAGAGSVAAGSFVGNLLPVAVAQEAGTSQSGAGGLCMTMIFEEGAKVKFDERKFVSNHLPLLRDAYGDSVERIELRTVDAPKDSSRALIATFGGRFAVRATTTLWIRDPAAFGQRLAASSGRINQDLDKVSKGNRLVQMERVVLALADARSEVAAEGPLYSMYCMPYTDTTSAPTFDQRYFVEQYLPKLHSMLGTAAVRRIEAVVGPEQSGHSPAQMAGFQIFIRDLDAFHEVSKEASADVLQKGSSALTQNTMSILTRMRVAGVA